MYTPTTAITTNTSPVLEKKESHPQVTLVMSFDPKMTPKAILDQKLKDWQSEVEKDLMIGYSSGEVFSVINKLRQLCKGLNFATHKQSLALFVSPDTALALYMDMPVEERIVIDSPFSMKDLLTCKSGKVEFLVLLLSARQSRMYIGNESGLRVIKTNTPQNVYAWLNEVPERAANFSDPSDRREVMLDKFLHHMDEGLASVLKAYPLPVFIIGDPRVTGHFGNITRHGKNIAGVITRNCQDATEKEILDVLQPQMVSWEVIRQQDLLRQVERSVAAGKAVFGLDEVVAASRYGSSRLLVVEKDLDLPGATAGKSPSSPFYIKDTLDDIIGKVLGKGGSIEWVDKGSLEKYKPIALIRY